MYFNTFILVLITNSVLISSCCKLLSSLFFLGLNGKRFIILICTNYDAKNLVLNN